MKGSMWVVILAAIVFLTNPRASAQGLPPGMGSAGAPSTAPPETLDVWLSAGGGAALSDLRLDEISSLGFGESWHLDAIADDGVTTPDSLTVSVPWISVRRDIAPDGGGFIARVYRVGPFRLGLDRDPTTLSQVLTVGGRLGAESELAPVRDPWRLERRRWPLFLLVSAVVVLGLLLRRALLGRSTTEIERITDPVPDPAWARFMIDAAALAEAGLPDGPGARPVMDRLDAMLRAYLRNRFGIDGTALAPGEIDSALVDRRYPRGTGAAFDALFRDLDIWRYAPTADSPPGRTRSLLNAACHAVEATGIDASTGASSARAGLAGEAARRKLRGVLGGGAAS